MLVTSTFSFSHNVFKRIFLKGCWKLELCGKELGIKIKAFCKHGGRGKENKKCW